MNQKNHQITESQKSFGKFPKLLEAMREMSDAIYFVSETAQHSVELLDALKAMVNMFDAVSKKIDWNHSFLDADALQKMNEAPVKARAAIERMENESTKN